MNKRILPRISVMILAAVMLFSVGCGGWWWPKHIDDGLQYEVDREGVGWLVEWTLKQEKAGEIMRGMGIFISRSSRGLNDPIELMDGYKKVFKQLEDGWPNFDPRGIYMLDKRDDITTEEKYIIAYDFVCEREYEELAQYVNSDWAHPIMRKTYIDLEPKDKNSSRHQMWREIGEEHGVW